MRRMKPSVRGRPRGGPATVAALLATAAVLALGPPAWATSLGQVDLRYYTVNPYVNAIAHLDGGTRTVVAGRYLLQVDTTPGTYSGQGEDVVDAANINGVIGTFCADLEQYTLADYTTYDVYHPELAPIGGDNVPMGIEKAWDLRRLFDQHTGDVGSHVGAAAFEASVWEIIYETSGTYDVTAGRLWMERYASWNPDDWLTLANSWLSSLGTDQPDVGLRVLANEGYQDYALWVPGLPTDPMPEPVTVAGLVMGIGCLGRYVRRRR